MRKKWMSVFLAMTLSVGMLCVNVSGAETEEEKTAGEITVWTQLNQQEIDGYIENFNMIYPDIKVNSVVIPTESYMTKLNATLRAGKNVPDVCFLENQQYGQIKETDFVEDLTGAPYNAGELNEEFIPYVADLNKDSQGAVKGLSYQSCPTGLWYNKKLAKEYLGTDDPDELAVMFDSWEKFMDKGEEVYDKSGGKVYLMDTCDGIPGLIVNERSEAYVVDNKLMGDDLFRRGIEFAVQFREKHGDAMLDSWTAPWAAGFYENPCFIFTALPSWGLHYAIKANTPSDAEDTDNSWGFCQAPVTSYNGGTWLSVCSASENKDLAWTFVKTITSNEEYLTRYVNKNGDVIAHMPTIEKIIESGFHDSFTGDQDIYKYMYEAAKNATSKGMTEYDLTIGNTYIEKLKLAAAGTMTADEALDSFKSDIKMNFPEIEIE